MGVGTGEELTVSWRCQLRPPDEDWWCGWVGEGCARRWGEFWNVWLLGTWFFLVYASVADERPLLNSFQGWSCFCSHFFWSCASWRLRAGLRQMSDLTLTSVLVSDFSVIFQASQACFMRCQSRYWALSWVSFERLNGLVQRLVQLLRAQMSPIEGCWLCVFFQFQSCGHCKHISSVSWQCI